MPAVIKEKLGHRIYAWIRSRFPFLFWRPLNPDWLSVLGTLIAGASALAVAQGDHVIAGLCLLGGGFFGLMIPNVAPYHFGSHYIAYCSRSSPPARSVRPTALASRLDTRER